MALDLHAGIFRIDVAQNIPLADGLGEEALFFVVTRLSDDRVHQIAPFASQLQRLLKLLFGGASLASFLENVDLALEIRLRFYTPAHFGNIAGQFLPLLLDRLELEGLKDCIARISVDEFVAGRRESARSSVPLEDAGASS